MSRSPVMFSVVTVILLTSSTASAIMLYEETFGAPDNPKGITDYGFINGAGGQELLVNSNSQASDSDGIDGDSYPIAGAREYGYFTLAVPNPTSTASATDYKVTFDAYVTRINNNIGTGHSGVLLGTFGSSAVGTDGNLDFGLVFQRANGLGWRFRHNFLTGTGEENSGLPDKLANVPVLGTIFIDLVNNMTSARVELQSCAPCSDDSDFIQFADQLIAAPVNDLSSIDKLVVLVDINPVGNSYQQDTGIDVDNIRVTATVPVIPEPATLGLALLSLVILAMRRRWR